MLPASTGRRKSRPLLKRDGRTVEIQRLIGRCLRMVVDFAQFADKTIYLDCDVLEADGGTRTAAITGAYVALCRATARASAEERIGPKVVTGQIAAVSVGVVEGQPLLDLCYAEDSTADVDMNLAMTGAGRFVELQGSAESKAFTADQLEAMIRLGKRGIRQLRGAQNRAIGKRTNR
jgi:ribonuclease PH